MTTQTAEQTAAQGQGCLECAQLTRRRFLGASMAIGGGLALASTMGTRVAMAGGYTGDVLVVLSLRGGFDGLSAVVPHGEGNNFYNRRPNIAVPEQVLLCKDSRFGLHPALAPLVPWWNNGTFGAVHAVGQPSGTRSHFQATEEMERAAPNSSLRSGWLDRAIGQRGMTSVFSALQVGDSLPSRALAGDTPELSMNSIEDFSLAGTNVRKDPAEFNRWTKAIKALNATSPAEIKQPLNTVVSALKTTSDIANSSYKPGASYPKGELGEALRDIARLIKAQIGVQIVCLDFNNWDMHEGLGRHDQEGSWMTSQLSELANCLSAFATDLGGWYNKTSVVTMSEFGRRAAENSSGGLDHGHGNVMFLMGGNVVGGRVHGTWPGMSDGQLDDGDLAGANDFRVVLAEILRKRCGQAGLGSVFPGADLNAQLGVVRG